MCDVRTKHTPMLNIIHLRIEIQTIHVTKKFKRKFAKKKVTIQHQSKGIQVGLINHGGTTTGSKGTLWDVW